MKIKYSYLHFLPAFFVFGFICNVWVAQAQTETINVIQDTYISQSEPDRNFNGDSDIFIGLDNGELLCGLVQFEDSALWDDNIVVDNATLNFDVILNNSLGDLRLEIAPIIRNWDANMVTINDSVFASSAYTDVVYFDASKDSQIDITSIAKLWTDKIVPNYGFKICYSKIPNETSNFSFASMESGFQPAYLQVVYHYPEVALGDPVDMQDAVVNNANSQDSVSISKDIIKLYKPKDKEIITTAKPVFEWKYLSELPKDTKPAIVVRKDDGQEWNALIEDEKDTTFSREDGFENGSYKWHMEILKEDKIIQKTDSWHFEIRANDLDEINKDLNLVQQPVVNENAVANSVTSTQKAQNTSVENKKIEDNIGEVDTKIQQEQKEEETQKAMLWGILIGVSGALLILIIVLGIIWYRNKKSKKSKDSKE